MGLMLAFLAFLLVVLPIAGLMTLMAGNFFILKEFFREKRLSFFHITALLIAMCTCAGFFYSSAGYRFPFFLAFLFLACLIPIVAVACGRHQYYAWLALISFIELVYGCLLIFFGVIRPFS